MQTDNSGIRDNRKRGTAGNFLKEKISRDAKLSFVSAYFTIYAYHALREKLDSISSLRFLFGEPRFIQTLDPDKTEKKAFKIEDDSLDLANKLEQKCVARECADWISSKVAIKSIKKPDFLHGKMYHIDNSGVEEAILGSSNFTVRGLGLGASVNNLELNLEVYSKLLKKSVSAISGGFKKRAVQNMLSGRDGILPTTNEQPKKDNDFELVTWVVIK